MSYALSLLYDVLVRCVDTLSWAKALLRRNFNLSFFTEKLEDLFSDVVVGCDIQGSTAVNNTVTDGGTSVFFPNPARVSAFANRSYLVQPHVKCKLFGWTYLHRRCGNTRNTAKSEVLFVLPSFLLITSEEQITFKRGKEHYRTTGPTRISRPPARPPPLGP